MAASFQGLDIERYKVIPRVIVFLRRGDEFLLLKGAPHKRLWAGKYNGIGGHLEQGEDPLTAALRELEEESGITALLRLCGVVIVDTGGPNGIALFIFTGEYATGRLRASHEGVPEWVLFERIGEIPTVEDLPVLLGRVRAARHGDTPFLGRSSYDPEGSLRIEFSE